MSYTYLLSLSFYNTQGRSPLRKEGGFVLPSLLPFVGGDTACCVPARAPGSGRGHMKSGVGGRDL